MSDGLSPGPDRPDGGRFHPPSVDTRPASGSLVGVGVEPVGHPLFVLCVTPVWDEWVARGPVTIRYAVAGLIADAVVEVDESSGDEFPQAISVSGAPDDLSDELCEIAESVFVTAWEMGRNGVEAMNRARAVSWALRNREAA